MNCALLSVYLLKSEMMDAMRSPASIERVLFFLRQYPLTRQFQEAYDGIQSVQVL